ncbi:hypothetical protein Zmor_005676 [Zophobas morio]|uniref:Uncharacterized protein n=1 Tax=Zophobas morio TaxID=2755281 RepID=A0AA38IWE0_9CUCU|nr:hypothetical protein Zmor_005676 [Zophobas morio]
MNCCLDRTVGRWFMVHFPFLSVSIWYSFMVCANICISGTASPRSWYLQPQTHDRGRDRTERILQAEKQILECDEEEPDISIRINNTPCLSAVGNLKLNCLFMFIHRKNVT